MDSLRWILLIAGLALIGGVYFFGHPSRRGSAGRKGRRDKNVLPFDVDDEPDDENLSAELDSLSRLIRDGDEPGAPGAATQSASTRSDESGVQHGDAGGMGSDGKGEAVTDRTDRESEEDDRLPENPDRIVVLNVRAREGNINGGLLFEAMSKAGLDLGPRKVFHRHHDGPDGPVPLFTVANMLKPGTFEGAEPAAITTPGVTLFMTLPGPMSALDIWDSMLATGNRLAELLDAELLDESFSTMGRQRSAHIREQMREYDRATEIRAQLHSPEGLR